MCVCVCVCVCVCGLGYYDNRVVAIKVSKPGIGEGIKEFLREAEVMMGLKHHKNVLALVGVCSHAGSALVVLEYVDGGSLDKLIESGHRFNESELRSMIKQIAAGLRHLHRSNLIHRDLAARNILLSRGADGSYIPKACCLLHFWGVFFFLGG